MIPLILNLPSPINQSYIPLMQPITRLSGGLASIKVAFSMATGPAIGQFMAQGIGPDGTDLKGQKDGIIGDFATINQAGQKGKGREDQKLSRKLGNPRVEGRK